MPSILECFLCGPVELECSGLFSTAGGSIPRYVNKFVIHWNLFWFAQYSWRVNSQYT
jgi:hypothetical protein